MDANGTPYVVTLNYQWNTVYYDYPLLVTKFELICISRFPYIPKKHQWTYIDGRQWNTICGHSKLPMEYSLV